MQYIFRFADYNKYKQFIIHTQAQSEDVQNIHPRTIDRTKKGRRCIFPQARAALI